MDKIWLLMDRMDKVHIYLNDKFFCNREGHILISCCKFNDKNAK